METETRTLPAGTIVKINGIPLALMEDAKMETHPGNWSTVLEGYDIGELGDL